jgi:hypothetical protein
MSRIRTIKPQFWVSEQVVACSRDARLLFIGFWGFCDDAGIHPMKNKTLKMEIFPGDDFPEGYFDGLIKELLNVGLLSEYYIDGNGYYLITGWHHQRIDKPTYRYPSPKTQVSPRLEGSNNIQRQLADESKSSLGIILDDSTMLLEFLDPVKEGKGKEGNVVKDICVVSSKSSKHLGEVNEVFDYWKLKMDHPRAKLDANRKRTIEAVLSLGYSIEQLKQAIDGCANTPYNMGKNEQMKKYDGIGLIFRDAEHVERFVQNNSTNQHAHSNNYTVSQIDQIGQGAI